MATIQRRKYSTMVVIAALIIGFVGGVIFTTYRTPDIITQIPGNKQTEAAKKAETARHIKHLEKSVAENDQDIAAWTKLAHAYFESNAYDKAITTYKKVLTLTPDDANIYTDLGVMYRRNKQPQQAVESFQKAIELDPVNVHAQFNSGIVLFHDLDDKEGAIKAWKQVAAIQPDYKLSTGQTIQQLLENIK